MLRINSIESFSTTDGDGVRSVIFLQGCHLRCGYCHNPETWDSNGGESVYIEELAEKVLRFKDYWGEGGGVTVSGGEPLLQAKELIPFLKLLKGQGVNVALDTSGAVAVSDDVREVIRLCDLVILDVKSHPDQRGGNSADSVTMQRFLDCARNDNASYDFLNECERQNKRIWIRIVIVPGINDTEEAIDEYAQILKGHKIEKVELVPFHTLGFDKYGKLGIENPLENTKACSVGRVRELQRRLDSLRE